MVPNECYLSKHNIYHLIHQHFGHVSSARLKQTARKVLMKGLPTNLPDLKDTYPIYILTKSDKIPRGQSINVSELSPGIMLQVNFTFLDVEIICGFTLTFLDIYSYSSYPCGSPLRSKRLPLDELKFIFGTFSNQD